jgi:hypothetical protein
MNAGSVSLRPKAAAMEFEWHESKAELNWQTHGITFTEAMTVFADPLSLTAYDPEHSDDEDRFVTIGSTAVGRLVVVSHTDRNEVIRLISAREATSRERKAYEDGNFP